MRNKKRIKLLELKLEYLNKYVELISTTVLEMLEREEEQNQKVKDLEAGKWYKHS